MYSTGETSRQNGELTQIFFVTHSNDSTAKRPGRPNPWCLKAPGLSSSQRKLCLRVPGLQTAIKKGIEKGLQECEREFQWNRWNCSLLDKKSLLRRAPGKQQYQNSVGFLENNSIVLLLTPTFVIVGSEKVIKVLLWLCGRARLTNVITLGSWRKEKSFTV